MVFIGAVVIFFTNYINSKKVNTNSRAKGVAPTSILTTVTPNPFLEPTIAFGEARDIKCLNERLVQNNTKVGLYFNDSKNVNNIQDLMPTPSIMIYVYEYDVQSGKHTALSKRHPEEIDTNTKQVLTIDKSKYVPGNRYYFSQIIKSPITSQPTSNNEQTLNQVLPTSKRELLNRCQKVD